jgi:hypothetical protein
MTALVPIVRFRLQAARELQLADGRRERSAAPTLLLPRAGARNPPTATRVIERSHPMTDHDRIWRALTREAASAAEHMAIGATAIGRARYDRASVYAQAFFALSVGFERSAKLALAINHALDGRGFPGAAELRNYGHDLRRLLHAVENVRRPASSPSNTAAFRTRTSTPPS